MRWREEILGDDGQVRILLGDCREILPTLAGGSIDFVFTDPPYGHNNNNGDLIARREAALGSSKENPAAPGGLDIESFRIKRIWPEPGTNWTTMSPGEWAEALVKLRKWSSSRVDSMLSRSDATA